MIKQEADWKRQPGNTLDWICIGLGAVLGATFTFLWWLEGPVQFLGLAVVFVAWLAIFFTAYWQPILYLVFATVVFSMMVLLIFTGPWEQPIVQVASVLAVGFVVIAVYLFTTEERGREAD